MWLLIDFGASYVKAAISSKELSNFFINMINKYPECRHILPCSIMGGGYNSGFYYSWKSHFKEHNSVDLISGMFTDSPTFHQHADHCENATTDIQPLTVLENGQVIYSNLADTECVRHSAPLERSDYLINMGTGSQILGLNYTHAFIPAGRAFNVFNNFFSSFGFNIFNEFKFVSLKDVMDSNMVIDLNVFPESHQYTDGGFIKNIIESGFTPKHFSSSLLRCFGDQYVSILKDLHVKNLYVTGGISQKLPVVVDYISERLGKSIQPISTISHSTHVGMSNRLKKQLI